MGEPPALGYIEKTLADAYRREIDAEENVWRTLPFFAATLALQLAALFQIIDKLPEPGSLLGWVAAGGLGAAAISTFVSLAFLAWSILPQNFDYIASSSALLAYAEDLIRDEEAPENQTPDKALNAVQTIKASIAGQYARATDHNRRINKRRERRRSVAGLAAIGSVLMTVLLVCMTYASYIPTRGRQAAPEAGSRPYTVGRAVDAPGPGPAPDGSGHQGLVGHAH